jgi:peroxiredoxin Q/BCP
VLKRPLATAAAIVRGVVHMVMTRHETPIELGAGDRAPDFSLPGSDGLTYRLSSLEGRSTVVLAWFPKAFTGG